MVECKYEYEQTLSAIFWIINGFFNKCWPWFLSTSKNLSTVNRIKQQHTHCKFMFSKIFSSLFLGLIRVTAIVFGRFCIFVANCIGSVGLPPFDGHWLCESKL
jgi:hypothetical protein